MESCSYVFDRVILLCNSSLPMSCSLQRFEVLEFSFLSSQLGGVSLSRQFARLAQVQVFSRVSNVLATPHLLFSFPCLSSKERHFKNSFFPRLAGHARWYEYRIGFSFIPPPTGLHFPEMSCRPGEMTLPLSLDV